LRPEYILTIPKRSRQVLPAIDTEGSNVVVLERILQKYFVILFQLNKALEISIGLDSLYKAPHKSLNRTLKRASQPVNTPF